MAQQGRLIKKIGSDLICLKIESKTIIEDIEYIKTHHIESVSLDSFEFNSDNIDFLKEIPFIKELHMGACPSVTNYSGLKYVDNLETLIIDPPKKVRIDLSTLQHLEFLSFEYNPNITGFANLKNLRELWVWKGTPDLFSIEIFSNYINLEKLHLYYSKIENLQFLKQSDLKELVLDHINKEFSLSGIETQKNMTTLKFINCRHVANVELISELTSINTLIIYGSFQLPSSRLIQNMTHLEYFTLTGSSFFIDGDLMPIEGIIKHLKKHYITQRNHYNLKINKIEPSSNFEFNNGSTVIQNP